MKRITQHPVLDVPERREAVDFMFDGRPMRGYDKEMISSALFANGVKEFSVHARGDVPQGIFCANGQCSKCTVIVDGFPVKSCVTALRGGMDIRTLERLPALPEDERPLSHNQKIELQCDVLVIGGGPSGLTATIELAKLGLKIILVDDKDRLGGKLLLQTHKFFGSIEDCFAGTRGVDIAARLEAEVRGFDNVEVLTDASAVGVYKDRKVGLFVGGKRYVLVGFEGLIVSGGAREKSLVFAGNDLPGVYGAGAFQTLVNRDLVRPASRVFIVGSGNVGLIAAYHALQAGIEVVGIIDILDRVGGYKVHADKIRRMGVPIYLRHTVLCAEGRDGVERVTIAEVNEDFQTLLETAKTFAVDTLLIAAGLCPVDEYYHVAKRFGFKVVKAGDADEIAEASSAMFGGRVAGLRMAQLLGVSVEADPAWQRTAEILKSRPGEVHPPQPVTLTDKYQPVFHCTEEIPCNPCTSVCKNGAVQLRPRLGNLMDIPYLAGECNGCTSCVAICPGLAITLVRQIDERKAEVVLPHEFVPAFKVGDRIPLMSQEGEHLEDAEVLKINRFKKHKTYLVRVAASVDNAARVAGIRVQDPRVSEPLAEAAVHHAPREGIVCRCERITLGEMVDYIREHEIRDANQLKQIRVAMGSCAGKTCPQLLPMVFREAGVDYGEVTPPTVRPLSVEMPMSALLNEEEG